MKKDFKILLIEDNEGDAELTKEAISSSALQKDINYAYSNHANCYIVKSWNLKDFLNTIKSVERFWMNCVTYPKAG